jgi:hypothetical protein
MPTRHVNPGQSNLSGNEESWRPPPVDVPLDNNASRQRSTNRGALVPSPVRRGTKTRRTIVLLAVGALGGAGLSQGLAHSHQSTAPTSATATPVVRVDQVPTLAASPTGDTVTDLVAGLDAVTQAQIAHAATTEGPKQVDAMRYLRQQHNDFRTLILAYFYGWLPYPMP